MTTPGHVQTSTIPAGFNSLLLPAWLQRESFWLPLLWRHCHRDRPPPSSARDKGWIQPLDMLG